MEPQAAGAGWTSPEAALSYTMGQFWLDLGQGGPLPRSCQRCCRQWLWGNNRNTKVRNYCEQTLVRRTDFRDALHLSDSLGSKGRGSWAQMPGATQPVLPGRRVRRKGWECRAVRRGGSALPTDKGGYND